MIDLQTGLVIGISLERIDGSKTAGIFCLVYLICDPEMIQENGKLIWLFE